MQRNSLWKAAFFGIYSFRVMLQSSGLEPTASANSLLLCSWCMVILGQVVPLVFICLWYLILHLPTQWMHTSKPSEGTPRIWDWSEMAEGCYSPRFQGSPGILPWMHFGQWRNPQEPLTLTKPPLHCFPPCTGLPVPLSGRQGLDPFSSFVCSSSLSGGGDISSRGTGKSSRDVLCRHSWDGRRALIHL